MLECPKCHRTSACLICENQWQCNHCNTIYMTHEGKIKIVHYNHKWDFSDETYRFKCRNCGIEITPSQKNHNKFPRCIVMTVKK